MRKDLSFNKWCKDNWIPTYKISKLDSYLTSKINLELSKDLNVKSKATKLIGENVGGNLCDLQLSNGLFATTPKAEETKKKKDKVGIQLSLHHLLKDKSFLIEWSWDPC